MEQDNRFLEGFRHAHQDLIRKWTLMLHPVEIDLESYRSLVYSHLIVNYRRERKRAGRVGKIQRFTILRFDLYS